MKMEITQETRPCKIHFKRTLKKEAVTKEGMFHGIWQHAHTFDAIYIGTTGGQISDPVAVVEIDGRLKKVEVNCIEFTDVVSEEDSE
ncbi:hypothetical protein [Enterococcus gilvus]|uniref:hypothetical protein n=1 Tax=Enterococcus gilvus TaxID=160453 RepID=UPI003EDABCEB